MNFLCKYFDHTIFNIFHNYELHNVYIFELHSYTMAEYVTKYPKTILVEDDQTQYNLTRNDNKKRVLINETSASLKQIQRAFQREGFTETRIEEKKSHQIGNGVLKRLSDEWDMHVRFLKLHNGLIAIDGEVETSRKWVEHNTEDNWISAIYEVSYILKKYKIQHDIWHKKIQKYVVNIVEEMEIQMTPLGKIKWSDVAILTGAITAGIVAAYLLLRKKKH